MIAPEHKEKRRATYPKMDASSSCTSRRHTRVDAITSAAMEVESAITIRARGPLSIAPVPLVDADLRRCLFFLLAIVTKLPFSTVTRGQAYELANRLKGQNSAVLLAELAWDVRRRLFRSAKDIERFDVQAFTVRRFPKIPAPLRIARTASDDEHDVKCFPVSRDVQGARLSITPGIEA